MSHTHRPDGRVCRFRTKKECAKSLSDWKRQKKAEYELKQIERREVEKAARLHTYEAYAAKERERARVGGSPV